MFKRSRKKSQEVDEAEKPFWISFADLMTAVMTLFLVVMAVTIVSVNKVDPAEDPREKVRIKEINLCLKDLKNNTDKRNRNNVKIEIAGDDVIRIGFINLVNFDHGDWKIDEVSRHFLRRYIPVVIDSVETEACQKHFKRVMIEGYTSPVGDYVNNLNLSNMRAQAVICALAKKKGDDPREEFLTPVSPRIQNTIKEIFFTGGFSFSAQKKTDAESRRAELKIEFWKLDEDRVKMSPGFYKTKSLGKCPAYFYKYRANGNG
jgi:flagellar motor protein MotB